MRLYPQKKTTNFNTSILNQYKTIANRTANFDPKEISNFDISQFRDGRTHNFNQNHNQNFIKNNIKRTKSISHNPKPSPPGFDLHLSANISASRLNLNSRSSLDKRRDERLLKNANESNTIDFNTNQRILEIKKRVTPEFNKFIVKNRSSGAPKSPNIIKNDENLQKTSINRGNLITKRSKTSQNMLANNNHRPQKIKYHKMPNPTTLAKDSREEAIRSANLQKSGDQVRNCMVFTDNMAANANDTTNQKPSKTKTNKPQKLKKSRNKNKSQSHLNSSMPVDIRKIMPAFEKEKWILQRRLIYQLNGIMREFEERKSQVQDFVQQV